MNVLGLHTVWHDTGACLVNDDNLVAISEERLSRVKYDGAFPSRSIDYVLDAIGANAGDVDIIVADHIKYAAPKMEKDIRAYGFRCPIHFISHHDAHAAGVYFQSDFDDAAVLVVDGTGSDSSYPGGREKVHYYVDGRKRSYELHSFYRATGGNLTLIRRTLSGEGYRGSIGVFYDGVSEYVNFGGFGAGKVMGLAPYGGNADEYRELVLEDFDGDLMLPGPVKIVPKNFKLYRDRLFHNLPPRANEDVPDDRYTELAFKAQYNCEHAVIAMARHIAETTGAKNLCLTGGVGLNSVSNKKITDAGFFENIFVHPACSDSGIPVGCALYGRHIIAGTPGRHVMKNAFMGRVYSSDEIEKAINSFSGFSVEKPGDLPVTTARLLTEGKIVGWLEGGSEIGPRALGHRSIVCDPRPHDAKDRLNYRVKHREGFRPFAPSVLLEKAGEYFELDFESPYMLMIAKVLEDKRDVIPAITHVDGTARIQTVTREKNGKYYNLISAFEELTGVPVILNTSFNVAGEPIVETPEDAIKCFLGTDIDALAIGGYLLSKS